VTVGPRSPPKTVCICSVSQCAHSVRRGGSLHLRARPRGLAEADVSPFHLRIPLRKGPFPDLTVISTCWMYGQSPGGLGGIPRRAGRNPPEGWEDKDGRLRLGQSLALPVGALLRELSAQYGQSVSISACGGTRWVRRFWSPIRSSGATTRSQSDGAAQARHKTRLRAETRSQPRG
jgi:hypothetical protein